MKLHLYNMDALDAFEATDVVVKVKDLVAYLQSHKKALQKQYAKTSAGELLTTIRLVDEMIDDINKP